jgi:hypothetical protein
MLSLLLLGGGGDDDDDENQEEEEEEEEEEKEDDDDDDDGDDDDDDDDDDLLARCGLPSGDDGRDQVRGRGAGRRRGHGQSTSPLSRWARIWPGLANFWSTVGPNGRGFSTVRLYPTMHDICGCGAGHSQSQSTPVTPPCHHRQPSSLPLRYCPATCKTFT